MCHAYNSYKSLTIITIQKRRHIKYDKLYEFKKVYIGTVWTSCNNRCICLFLRRNSSCKKSTHTGWAGCNPKNGNVHPIEVEFLQQLRQMKETIKLTWRL